MVVELMGHLALPITAVLNENRPDTVPVCPFPKSFYPSDSPCSKQDDVIGPSQPLPAPREDFPTQNSSDIFSGVDEIGDTLKSGFFMITLAVSAGLFFWISGK